MQTRHSRFGLVAAIVLLIVGGTASCVDETVFREGPLFRSPPAAAAGFLGYDEQDRKLTVCGNCHIGQQSRWETTAHADAFATLANSGEMQGFCQGCHTVNQRGNASPDVSGGWVGTNDTRYHDVQCENCHGPGLTHVEDPDASQPLAPITVGLDLEYGCGECHSGAHHPFVEDWKASRHGRVTASVASRATTDPAGARECMSCHTAQGALEAWGVDANYIERNDALAAREPIVCATCHDPHGKRPGFGTDITKQLRYSISVPDEENNLCIKCHHKRAQPDIDPVTRSSRGPHSPEGPLLLGENVGFWFGDTIVYDGLRIRGTHGTERNPRLCATCHVDAFPVTDLLTGDFVIQVTGHDFAAVPCVDANGRPTGETDCAVSARSFRGCTASGCHGDQDAARSAWVVTKGEITGMAATLKALIDQVRTAEVKGSDGRWTTAEGADFNYQLALKKGSEVHNPFLIKALLAASIEEMREVYGLTVPPSTVDHRQYIGTQ